MGKKPISSAGRRKQVLPAWSLGSQAGLAVPAPACHTKGALSLAQGPAPLRQARAQGRTADRHTPTCRSRQPSKGRAGTGFRTSPSDTPLYRWKSQGSRRHEALPLPDSRQSRVEAPTPQPTTPASAEQRPNGPLGGCTPPLCSQAPEPSTEQASRVAEEAGGHGEHAGGPISPTGPCPSAMLPRRSCWRP